jgi:hypothetical protein
MTHSAPLRPLLLAAAVATFTAAAPAPAAAAEFRNEVALEWMPGALANDGRRSRDISYNREFGNGFAVGYGNVHKEKSDDGLLVLRRGRWRSPYINALGFIKPQIGIEYGGTTNVFQTADLAGVYFGVHMEASPELGVTVDYWTGNSHYESGNRNEKRSVNGVRLGLAFRY